MGTVRLGVDIGGTFTDLVLLDENSGNSLVVKVPSRPKDLAGALVEATTRGISEASVKPESVAMLNHGTTIITNAVLEGTLAPVALIGTKGFRDVLEIGRHLRPDMYDLNQDKPKPIVPRDLRFEVEERMAPDGTVVTPLNIATVTAAIEALKAADVSAVAVSFLHAYANPDHEAMVKDALTKALPGIEITVSTDICREIREFERTSTVVLNAAAMPVVSRYLEVLSERMAAVVPKAQVLLMQSNGGSMTVNAARRSPAQLIYSGPAAGVLACQFVGRMTGQPNVLGFDMGGTSTDISLVYRGEPLMTTEADVGGYPVKLPVLDINTIGAGGGSIAWIDSGGGLQVGPRSAGADPGPVAYGRGGTEPTVADANLALGRFSPDRFLGGELALDRDASLAAIKEKIAGPLGLDPIAAAAGILRIANANMGRALKVSSAERGYDPRDFTLIAFGGGGPAHGAALAKEVGFPSVLVPSVPGVFSAFGLLIADIRHDYVQSYISRADEASLDVVSGIFDSMKALGEQALTEDAIADDQREYLRTADLRYVGQAYEVNVPVPDGPVDKDLMAAVVSLFHEEHQRQFAHSSEGDPVEIVNLRMIAMGRVEAPELGKKDTAPGNAVLIERREVYFEESGGFVDCPIFERDAMGMGTDIVGPAIIEQLDCTTVVHPGQKVSVDEWGNLIISMGG